MRSWRLIRGIPVLGLALVLLGAACVSAQPEPEPPTASPPPVATATAKPSPPPAQPPVTVPTLPTPPDVGEQPTPEPYDGEVVSMRLPSLDVEASIERIGLVEGINHKQLDVPEWRNVGWYEIYDKPGFGTSSLFSAHKDYYPDKQGPFYELSKLRPGDQIIVEMDDGREYVYEVFLQERYVASEFPVGDLIRSHEAEEPTLRRPPDEEWIALYTCGGEFVPSRPGGPGQYVHRDLVVGRLVQTNLPGEVQAASQQQ